MVRPCSRRRGRCGRVPRCSSPGRCRASRATSSRPRPGCSPASTLRQWPEAKCRPPRRGQRRSARSPITSRTPTPHTISRRTSPSASCRRSRRGSKARSCATKRCRRGRWPTCRPGSMIEHLKTFLRFLALNRNLSAHTVRAYESDLTQFIGFAAAQADVKKRELDAAQLDRTVLRGFLADLHKQGQSRATAARKLAAVRTFLRYLRREAIIHDDPGSLIATPKRDIRMPAHLSEAEMTALLDTPAADTALSRRDRAILELFYASGLRLSELAGLDMDDLNMSGRMVRVLGKGGKERLVPFNTSAARALRAYLADRAALAGAGARLERDGRGTDAARAGRLVRSKM